jgi:hypothetical protein
MREPQPVDETTQRKPRAERPSPERPATGSLDEFLAGKEREVGPLPERVRSVFAALVRRFGGDRDRAWNALWN